MTRIATALVALLVLTAAPAARAQDAPPPVQVVVSNIGNINVTTCLQDYVVKLCVQEVEDRARAAFAQLRPEVLVLIEVLPDGWCTSRRPAAPAFLPGTVCADGVTPTPADLEPSQARRVLGPDYDIRCTQRFGWDCVALRRDVATFAGPPAAVIDGSPRLETVPAVAGCDTGFTVNAADVVVRGRPLRVLAGHPNSSNDTCRTEELRRLLAIAGDGPTVLAGDFNLDPFRGTDASTALWNANVGPGRRFTQHNDDTFTSYPAEPGQLVDPTGQVRDPGLDLPPPTAGARTIDNVASDALEGPVCAVIRVDGGGGMDHRTLDCRLRFRAAALPAPVVPEAPLAALLPVVALAAAAVALRRRAA